MLHQEKTDTKPLCKKQTTLQAVVYLEVHRAWWCRGFLWCRKSTIGTNSV